MNSKPNSPVLIQVGIVICLLLVWEWSGRSFDSLAFSVGTPVAIGNAFGRMLFEEELLRHLVVTGTEAVVGLLIGTTLGFALGLSLWFSDRAAYISRPFVVVLGSLPIIAFAPLMIIWFGVGIEMKIVLAALSTLFIAFNQAHRGIRAVSGNYVELMRGMNAPRSQIFFKVIVPGSMDWMFSSMRLNIGFGLLGAFIGEFIASDQGLGYLIMRASALYNVPRAFAAAVGIACLALGLDAIGSWVEKHRHFIVQFFSVSRKLWQQGDASRR